LAQGFINSNDIESLKFLKGYKTYNNLSPIESNDLKIKSLNFTSYLKSSKIAPILYQAINPLILKNTLSNYKNHIFHNPNYYSAPFDGVSVVTFHDLSMYLWPQTHPISRVRYMQKEIEKTLKRTNVIITDTEFIRHELANYFGFSLDKIITVNLASGNEFKQRNKEELSQFLRDIGLEFQGILFL
jgi:alpha-1,3-rhamnosyl/mannosyltransferase